MFIAFEGLDGSGSTTQSRLLAERLEGLGRAVFLTKEPTNNTPVGKLIREVLQHKWEASAEGLQLLFCADRAEHLKNEIEPALKNGQMVITDRYLLSTIAYGAPEIHDMKWLNGLNQRFRQPDVTFLFKLAPTICLERIAGRGNDLELFERHEKLTTIWENYKKLAQDFENIFVIDANRSIEEIASDIWGVMEVRLIKRP